MATINDRLDSLEDSRDKMLQFFQEMLNVQKEQGKQLVAIVATLEKMSSTLDEHTLLLKSIVDTQQKQSISLTLIEQPLG